MRPHFLKYICLLFLALGLTGSSHFALDWEVERSFRYFVFPSDIAVQRVASDMYKGGRGRDASPEDLEHYLNGPTAYDLIRHLREVEGRGNNESIREVERLGWASLLAHKSTYARPLGNTDTCWDPRTRLHSNCARYGDYARPVGWIVRAFDADAPQKACKWTGDGGFLAGAKPESDLVSKSGGLVANQGPWTQTSQDCQEIRIYIPSDPVDRKAVKGRLKLTRIDGDGSIQTLEIAPSDQLIIGFGDSFTSGEGNPELPATFTNIGWPDANLPKRSADPATRAQWNDRWRHRSVYSWQLRTALDVALRSPQCSVTILPYGCSGAEIFSGLLYAYNGVEYDHATDNGVIGHRSAFGLAYQELCDPQSYARVTGQYNQPVAQNDDALNAAVSAGVSVEKWTAGLPSTESILAAMRKNVTRCNPRASRLKCDADLILLDIGINDVRSSSWVAGLILDEPLRSLADGFIPQMRKSGQACDSHCARTELLLARLAYRYRVLREVLEKQFLPDVGLDAAHSGTSDRVSVIVPLCPKALEDENGNLCGFGNRGMTVTTFPHGLGLDDALCETRIWPKANGPITAIRRPEDLKAIEWFRENELNKNLRDFALPTTGADPYDVVDKQVDRFAKRGFCATLDAASRPPPGQCFTYSDPLNMPCSLSTPESLHVPRNGNTNCGPSAVDFSPFSASDYMPYRSRTRLLRTQNDVYLLIDNRDKNYTDETKAGILDLNGRTTSGAFHPTAEGHSIVASAASEEACKGHCHVWMAPAVKGSFDLLRWSRVRSCLRPFSRR
jgi:hypothetical protein